MPRSVTRHAHGGRLWVRGLTFPNDRCWRRKAVIARLYAPSVCGQLFANYFERRSNDAGAFGYQQR